jgi:hypothetical protein
MKRQIRWTERLEDGVKKDVRVSFHGDDIKWQFRRSDSKYWDYETPPTSEEWDELEDRILKRYQRGHLAIEKELELVRRKRGE